jgi:hypothetical protein
MIITLEEYNSVLGGIKQQFILKDRQYDNLLQQLKTALALNDELRKYGEEKDKEVLKQFNETERWKALYILAKKYLTKSGETRLNIKLHEDY